jgi:geranylgeranyl diphosphate synthase type I
MSISRPADVPDVRHATLLNALAERRKRVAAYIAQSDYARRLAPPHLRDAALSYLRLGGKSLRPAVLLLSCGAVGGDEARAVPAAAGIEVYHTWTLVHDDVIDRDDRRRGAPTVHVEFAGRGERELGYAGEEAAHYGRTIAILAGDVQQSWSYMLFHELHTRFGVDPALVLRLVGELATDVQLTLVEGETLDVQYARTRTPDLSEAAVLEMLRKKTGMLYEFAGRAGAMIGLGDVSGHDPAVERIARFCGQCGTAFQLQDDILGAIGDPAITGKPVGADLREGKKTIILFRALQNADEGQRRKLMGIVGRMDAAEDEIRQAARLLDDLDGIGYTRRLMKRMIEDATGNLDGLPPTPSRDLLRQWADYLIDRQV